MADTAARKPRGPSDPTDYSSTQAPETQEAAEGRRPVPTDDRLVPGGPEGAAADPGMTSQDKDLAGTGGTGSGESDIGSTGALDKD